MRLPALLRSCFRRPPALPPLRSWNSSRRREGADASGPAELVIRPGETTWLIARAVSLKAF